VPGQHILPAGQHFFASSQQEKPAPHHPDEQQVLPAVPGMQPVAQHAWPLAHAPPPEQHTAPAS